MSVARNRNQTAIEGIDETHAFIRVSNVTKRRAGRRQPPESNMRCGWRTGRAQGDHGDGSEAGVPYSRRPLRKFLRRLTPVPVP
jgi:hypothetical protein